MKVRVKAEFKDKYTGKLHKAGTILDLNVQRINEILKVGCFVELIEQAEQSEPEETEQVEETPDENTDAGEQTEETPKQTGRRKRTK